MEDQIISNKFVTIKHSFNGAPREADFELVTTSINMDSQSSNRVVVKSIQVSIDPYQLNRMKIYSPSHDSVFLSTRLVPGQIIDAYGVGKVIDSKDPRFRKDDLVVGLLSWAQYTVLENAQHIQRLDSTEFPLSYHLGVLGFSGLTAYAGLFKVGKPKKGDKIFVSAASGSVGSLVGQYAKLFGCYVVGCAGTIKKVALLKEKLGFDDAFNYKEEGNLKLALKRYFPEGIDIYFDNVGGEMQEAAIANMNYFGRVVVCGVISEYCNPTGRIAAPNMINIIYKRITIQGFLAGDYLLDEEFYANFLSTTSNHIRTGQLKVLEDISFGLQNIPSAFINLFNGRNIGKTVVPVLEE